MSDVTRANAKRRPTVRRDLTVNVLGASAQGLLLLAGIRMAGDLLAPAQLALFLLARRIVGTGAPLLQLGLSQAETRYVAVAQGRATPRKPYIAAGYGLVVVLASGGVLLVFGLQAPIASWWFGADTKDTALVFWTGVSLGAMAVGSVVQGVLLADRWMVTENVVETLNGGGLFVVSLLALGGGENVASLLAFHSAGVLAVSAIAATVHWTRSLNGERLPGIVRSSWELLRFGLPRAPSAFLNNLVFLVGPWLLRGEPGEAAALVIALTLVRLVQVALTPVSQVSGVTAARQEGAGRDSVMRAGVSVLVGGIIHGSAVLCGFLYVIRRPLTTVWLGDNVLAEAVLAHLVLLIAALPAVALFHGLRGVIEVRRLQPLNLYTLVGALIAQVLIANALGGSRAAIDWSILLSLWVMGAVSVLWLRDLVSVRQLFDGGRLPAMLVATSGAILFAINDGMLSIILAPLCLMVGVLLSVRSSSLQELRRLSGRRHTPPDSDQALVP